MEDEGTLCTIEDLYRMSYQASEEGLSFSEYLHRQELNGISLEKSIENARVGASTSDYLQQRETVVRKRIIRKRRLNDFATALPVLGLVAMLVGISTFGEVNGDFYMAGHDGHYPWGGMTYVVVPKDDGEELVGE